MCRVNNTSNTEPSEDVFFSQSQRKDEVCGRVDGRVDIRLTSLHRNVLLFLLCEIVLGTVCIIMSMYQSVSISHWGNRGSICLRDVKLAQVHRFSGVQGQQLMHTERIIVCLSFPLSCQWCCCLCPLGLNDSAHCLLITDRHTHTLSLTHITL